MVETIVMPKLGFNMSEGKLVRWYKQEGEAVRRGEALFSVETDKTAIDVEATRDGVLRRLLVREGETTPVTLPIAIVADANEDIEAELRAARAKLAGTPDAAAAGATQSAKAPEGGAEGDVRERAADAPRAPGGACGASPDYDVIVIGGGPGGYVAAIRAAQLGKRVALIEKERVGGVCLNRGCIPTKTFLHSAETLRALKRCEEFAVSGVDAGRAALDMSKLQHRKDAIVSRLVGGVEALLKKNGITKIEGTGRIVDPHSVAVNGKSYTTAYIIIATGSVAKRPPVKADGGMHLFTSDELLSATELPPETLVIGGGAVGTELAYFLASAGVRVTIVEFLTRILPTFDAEIAELAAKQLENLGVRIFTGARATEITKDAVFFEVGGETRKEETRHVLSAVGRAADLGGIDCEALGIALERGAIVTDASLRTSVPNIFAIGDVNGKHMLAHTASMEGITAAETIAGIGRVMRYDRIPNVVYLHPELAGVGLSEDLARAQCASVSVGRFPLAANGKAVSAGENEGLVKIVADAESGEILGVHLCCAHAADMIAEAAMAMELEATAEEFAMTVHPHPTISEAMQEAAHAVLGKAIHF